MKNYVIINGINSNTITGLMINELPPITKPQMRVQSEEIDGRDGDITTNLGYSAYDKTITIGLFGTGYDINDIISFFNGEGTIVFSNENDKYYNFKIISQIDYETLQKFKVASITFHCQPFKYPLEETPIELEYQYIEATDVEQATLNNTGEALMQLTLKGNTSQESTPTPTTPVEVKVVSGDNTIKVEGKNLFDGIVETINGYSYSNGVLTCTSTGVARANYFVAEEESYTFSFASTQASARWYVEEFDSNFNQLRSTPKYGTTSFTIGSDAKYFRPVFNLGSTASFPVTITDIQLEKGSTATTYEPYQSQSYNVNLGSLELCKIGNYQDYFYKDSGKWYKHSEIGKVVLDGSETWTTNTTSSAGGTLFNLEKSDISQLPNSTTTGTVFSNNFSPTTPSAIWANLINGITNLNGANFIRIRCVDITTLDAFKTWLGTHNTIVYYVLATPTYTEIEDTNLISQLNTLQNAMSYKGQTNVSQVNDDEAFILDIKALEDGSNETIINNIGNVYSKPLLELEGNGNIDIYLNGNQTLQANVEDKMNIDIDKLEAYNPDTKVLLNRQVIGNYNSMKLSPGENTLKIDGALDKATITNYTRWL